jgi:hypothetical protein
MSGKMRIHGSFRAIARFCQTATQKRMAKMRKFIIAGLCIGALTAGSGAVEAKGCIKGAIVGGVAGHYAGHHGLLGAAAGCLAGRHLAKQRATAPQTAPSHE